MSLIEFLLHQAGDLLDDLLLAIVLAVGILT
jgi:hypothetical protein